jgi:hypothetical protein
MTPSVTMGNGQPGINGTGQGVGNGANGASGNGNANATGNGSATPGAGIVVTKWEHLNLKIELLRAIGKYG